MESHLWLERPAEVTRTLKPVEPVLDLKLLRDLANPIATL